MPDKYFDNIKSLIERDIIEQTKHQIKSNSHKLVTYHNIGKELVEAEKDVDNKYGAGIVKNYAKKLKEEYGNNYDYSSLTRMKKLFLTFPNIAPPGQLSWTHYKLLLPIKDNNKRNFYINTCIEHGLSKRDLDKYMKSNAYERLNNQEEIKLKYSEDNNTLPDIINMIKNPIYVSLNESIDKLTEKILKELLLEQIEYFMLEAGTGFAFVGSEKPIKLDGKTHYVDLVFFNYIYNCFVIIELKLNDLKKADIGQIEFYVNYYDDVKKRTIS